MKLSELFPKYTRRDWEELVKKTAGATPEELSSTSPEGLPIELLYTPSENSDSAWDRYPALWEALFNAHRSRRTDGWDIRQAALSGSTARVVEDLERDGERGVDSVWLKVAVESEGSSPEADAPADRWVENLRGVPLSRAEELTRLAGVARRKELKLWLEAGADPLPLLSMLKGLAPGDRNTFSAVYTSFFGSFLEPGRYGSTVTTEYWEQLASLLDWSRREGWPEKSLCFDGLIHNWSGASAPVELAGAIASAVEVMRNLEGRGVSPEEVVAASFFKVGVGREFFTELAKLRALRILWNRIAQAVGLGESDSIIPVHAVVSPTLFTREDHWNNLLRGMSGIISAALGEADAITFIPFDSALGSPSERGKRLSATFQLVASRESELNAVFDPAAGSWFIESLTEEIAQRAWELFRDIERRGGFLKALRTGFWNQILKEEVDKKANLMGEQKFHLLGVTIYPPPAELSEASRAKVEGDSAEHRPEMKGEPRELSREEVESLRNLPAKEKVEAFSELSREGFSLRFLLDLNTPSIFRGEPLPPVRYITLEELASLVRGESHE